jgi:N-acetylglucosaminyldiphosphoundecaprenol N-acetyl-beta-D-mannosaminyltransferase
MRTIFFKSPIDILTKAETIQLAREAMRLKKTLVHVSLNVAKLVNMRSDPVLAEDVKNSDLVGIDGMGILLGARLLGQKIPERVAGIDLFEELLAICANDGFRPYFLGASSEVVLKAVAKVKVKYPSIQFAGARDGYFTNFQEAEIVEDIRNSHADCLFIGLPTPRKERFLAAHRDQLKVPFIMGVGGSFDVIAGHVTRAPRSLQKWGLEWLYRIYQEPRRMWWRYTRTNIIFAGMMSRAVTQVTIRKLRDYLIPLKPKKPSGPVKLLAVASGGGHWVQLLRLMPAFADLDVAFVSTLDSSEQVSGRRFYQVIDGNRWRKLALVKMTLQLAWIVLKERPDAVISTGAAAGYVALRLGRIFSARTIWIDSIANVDELSMSGRLVRKHADLWLTQWSHLARPGGPHFAGTVV